MLVSAPRPRASPKRGRKNMPKFLLLYRGPQGDPSSATPEEYKAVMDAWNGYFAKHGKAIVDGGNPTQAGVNVPQKGKAGKAADVTGYSIIDAKDMKAAQAMMKGHPHFLDPRGGNSIDVFEITPLI
jgi:hypothetical protein